MPLSFYQCQFILLILDRRGSGGYHEVVEPDTIQDFEATPYKDIDLIPDMIW